MPTTPCSGFRFLDARLPSLVEQVLPGGVFLAETFHANAPEGETDRPRNPDYLLQVGEYREMFSTWEVVKERMTNSMSRIMLRKPGWSR
ncbi:MAG: hypothetical protein U1D30_03845 [Planctomycetota bacterium]